MSKSKVGIGLVAVWLLFTVSLASWWLIFGLRHVELERTRNMLVMEGTVLILCILGGGLALLIYMRREQIRTKEKQDFFAAFTHDIKTSITSLRLQAESLQEEVKNSKVLSRLVNDSVRLQLQLENSLYLANLENNQLLNETFSLQEAIQTVRYHWPDLQLHLNHDFQLQGDRHAFESIFRNIIQNCILHAKAENVNVDVETFSDKTMISVTSDGHQFVGDIARLGQPFYRPGTSRGTGIGLYISQQLAKKMKGQIKFTVDRAQRLAVQIQVGHT